ncbi:MAG: hypothetical protein ABSD74_18490 [Rhizomicrobium sp.]|jgi:hypothetical protein
MMRLRILVLGSLAVAAIAGRAEAQQPYPIQEMNFDMWCQEEKHLPPERCDQRLPDDDAEFQAYRNTIEKYEIPYLQHREQQENLNRVIIHGDPIDHPDTPSAPQVPGGTTPASGTSTSQQ